MVLGIFLNAFSQCQLPKGQCPKWQPPKCATFLRLGLLRCRRQLNGGQVLRLGG